jgi:hypothetical protein
MAVKCPYAKFKKFRTGLQLEQEATNNINKFYGMRTVGTVVIMALINMMSYAQNIYMTRNGQASFFSKTPMENIEAVNNEVNSMINPITGEIVFAILVKGFRFEKALMEEHFNENYMESNKIPKSTFQGKIINLAKVDFTSDGSYPITVDGDLTIHGVKKHITPSGTLTVDNDKVTVMSSFLVKLADFNIERPALVTEKIAESVEIKIDCRYETKR